MKFSLVLLAITVTLTSAAEFPGQPACASACISQAVAEGTNCDIEDTACQCQASNLAGISSAIVPCILGACTAAGEIQQAQNAPNRCTIAPAETTASESTSTTETASESSTSSASPGSSSSSSGPASTSEVGSLTTAPATTSRPGNGTVTTGGPTATSSTAGEVTANAGHSVGLVGVGGMVGLLAAVVAAL
ncbi:uncharacterized protein EAF01_009384 [Botrytis porri]|uniref:CFEM domain-containing protein n=1 Tax=Botrytis porri TaxID=87229 RepID=A0A4Z1KZP2_9HELO|nr:uncharacterized protein EAF01_009384 [Botrytis porri]KAF7896981.1 hypothetical protein EAF01_009384 [Botrytis porri]TGO89961.1 hypothetical protein BPOR_0085g00070 [Botrytis porri]